jgi:hypothetical protein
MTRHAVEPSLVKIRLVHAHRQSADKRGKGTADFAKTMTGLDAVAAAVGRKPPAMIHGTALSAEKPDSGLASHDVKKPVWQFAPGSHQFVEDGDSAPEFTPAHEATHAGPPLHQRIAAVFIGVAVAEPAGAPALQVPAAGKDMPQVLERTDPKMPGEPESEDTTWLAGNLGLGNALQHADHHCPSCELETAGQESPEVRTLSLTSADEQVCMAVTAPETEECSDRITVGGLARPPLQGLAPVPVSETRLGSDFMSMRVDAGLERGLAVKECENEDESGVSPSWDAMRHQLRHDAVLRAIPGAEQLRAAAPPDRLTTAATVEESRQDETVILRPTASNVLATLITKTDTDRHVEHEIAGNEDVRESFFVNPAIIPEQKSIDAPVSARADDPGNRHVNGPVFITQVLAENASGPQLPGAALGEGPEVKPADRRRNMTQAQTPEIPAREYRILSPARAGDRDSKPAPLSLAAANKPPGMDNGENIPSGATAEMATTAAATPDRDSARQRISLQLHAQTPGGHGTPTRHPLMSEIHAEVTAGEALAVSSETVRTSRDDPAANRGSMRDLNGFAPWFAKLKPDAASSGKVASAGREKNNASAPEVPVALPTDHLPPDVQVQASGSVGPRVLGQASDVKLQPLQQILQLLQMELAAVNKPASSSLKQLKIRLQPESLGEVDITLRKNGRSIDVRLEASLGTTATALQIAKDELASALSELGFDRASLSIEVKGGWQVDPQHEAATGRDLQQVKPDSEQRNLADQHDDRRRERTNEGRNEEIERRRSSVRDTGDGGSRRGIYI